MIRIICPHCDAAVEVAAEHLGADVQCGSCFRAFQAVQNQSRLKRSQRDIDDFDDEEEYRRPRRFRGGFEPEPDSYQEALDVVRPAALGLIWTGWLGAILHVIAGLIFIGFGMEMRNNPVPKEKDDDLVFFMVLGFLIVVFAPIFCILLAVGGHKLRTLRSYPWPMTSAILGIAMIFVFGICDPIAWFSAGFGIYALIVIHKPVVKWAIDKNQKGVRNRVEF